MEDTRPTMNHPTPSNWLSRLTAIRRFIANSDGPITFLIGAGASVSSGAPTTRQVEAALHEAMVAGDSRYDLRSAAHRINEEQKRIALLPLFKTLIPNVGYRLLANLGRERQIRILNLNWDMLAERACELVGVAHRSFNLQTATPGEIADAGSTMETGVICVHLHGRIGLHHLLREPIQFGLIETLTFDDSQTALLRDEFFRHPTIIVGASLNTSKSDTDMWGLLTNVGNDRGSSNYSTPIYVLTREQPTDALTRLLYARSSTNNVISHHLLDFDRAIFELQSHLPHDHTANVCPSGSGFAWTNQDLVLPALDSRVTLIAGERFIGKTTLATNIASIIGALNAPKGSVRVVSGDGPVLETFYGMQPNDVLVIDDAFGKRRFDPNAPSLKIVLRAVADPFCPRLVLTSRLSVWETARNRRPANVKNVTAISSSPDSWYSPANLLGLSHLERMRTADRQRVESLIRRRILCKPIDVEHAVDDESQRHDRAEVVRDKARLFRKAPILSAFAALLRLSHFSDIQLHAEDAAGIIGKNVREIVAISAGILTLEEHDGLCHVHFTHDSDIEAIDLHLREGSVFSALYAFKEQTPWLGAARSRWRAIRRVALNTRLGWRKLSTSDRNLIASSVIARKSDPETFERIRKAARDPWSFKDVVLEVVRNWPQYAEARTSAGQNYVDAIMNNNAKFGVVAVLEAALTLQHSTHAEIWTKLISRIWDVPSDTRMSDREAALIFDALLWKSSAGDRLGDDALLKHIITGQAVSSPRRGGFAMAMLYHWDRAVELDLLANFHPLDVWVKCNDAQIAEALSMVQWHYIASCRAWARRWVYWDDSESLAYMRRHRARRAMTDEYRSQITAAAIALENIDPGWALFLLVNLSCVFGEFEDIDRMRRILNRCKPGNLGVLAVATSHELPKALQDDFRRYFRDEHSRMVLLDSFRDGITIDGVLVRPPAFRALGDSYRVETALGIDWPKLRELGVDTTSAVAALGKFRPRIRKAVHDYLVAPTGVWPVLKALHSGDLRSLASIQHFRPSASGRHVDDPILEFVIAFANLTPRSKP
jgi:hypothetical protein